MRSHRRTSRSCTTGVEPGFIRVDADEVTYPAHVIPRYELERGLDGRAHRGRGHPRAVGREDAAVASACPRTANYRDGCIQDIHRTDGLFYYPSYTLGAMYAAQLRFALERELGDMGTLRRVRPPA